jgi:hypothetical protein
MRKIGWPAVFFSAAQKLCQSQLADFLRVADEVGLKPNALDRAFPNLFLYSDGDGVG